MRSVNINKKPVKEPYIHLLHKETLEFIEILREMKEGDIKEIILEEKENLNKLKSKFRTASKYVNGHFRGSQINKRFFVEKLKKKK